MGDLASLIARKQPVGDRQCSSASPPRYYRRLRTPRSHQRRLAWVGCRQDRSPIHSWRDFGKVCGKLGYVEGQNINLEIRHAHGNVEALRSRSGGVGTGKRCPDRRQSHGGPGGRGR